METININDLVNQIYSISNFLFIPIGFAMGFAILAKITQTIRMAMGDGPRDPREEQILRDTEELEELNKPPEPSIWRGTPPENKLNRHICQYCGNQFIPNKRGGCSACGAPKG